MSIKTNELQVLSSILPDDHFLVDSETKGTGRVAFSTIIPSNAAAHNAIYRGKNIQDKYIDGSLYTAIENGTFEDLFIGDYFDITITTSLGGSETVRCMLAGFDVYWGCGDTAMFTHHAVIVPANCFATTAKMNTENVTTGGYTGSEMYTTVLPVYQTALETVFGNRLLNNRELLTNAVTDGKSSGWAWFDCKLRLMSEAEVYGGNVWSSGYDVGIAKTQLPLFTLNPAKIVCGLGGANYASNTARYSWWLSAVTGAAYFAFVNYGGYAYSNVASDALGVRPRFLIS